jgi:hypothetical protein
MANEIATRIAARKAKPPAHREKTDAKEEIKRIAAQGAPVAMAKLKEVMLAKDTPGTARVQAINSWLERAGGKVSAVERPETELNQIDRMSQAERLRFLCEEIVAMSQESRNFIAEALFCAQKGLAFDPRIIDPDFDEEEALKAEFAEYAPPEKPKAPRKEPRR